MKRIKLTQPIITTRAAAEKLIGEIASLIIDHRKAAADLDAELLAVRQDYETDLSSLEKQIKEKTALAQQWADANPQEFGPHRALQMVHAEVGYRTGMPQCKPLPGFTWDRVLEKLQAFGYRDYIRTTEEVDKQKLITTRSELTEVFKKEIGIRIYQAETFFVEPKLTNQPSQISAAA